MTASLSATIERLAIACGAWAAATVVTPAGYSHHDNCQVVTAWQCLPLPGTCLGVPGTLPESEGGVSYLALLMALWVEAWATLCVFKLPYRVCDCIIEFSLRI